MKKKALVDVPVKINIWIRPECQRKQFEVIKQARPNILFVVSDGGRNETEWEIIWKHRKMYETEINWECKVYQLYEDVNNGLYELGKKRDKLVWNTVDRCIFLEDDHIPSVSFFRFCAETLKKYEADERINCICGMNHIGVSENVTSDYFFSRQGAIWGYATWKRVYDKYYDFEYGKDDYTMSLLKSQTKHNHIFWKRLVGYSQGEIYEGHVAATEFFIEFAIYGQNQLQIIPKKNLISNIGCTEAAVHSDDIKVLPHGMRRIFNMPLYELDFPLKHPKYVIPDAEYEKRRNRIMAYNHPVKLFFWKVEQTLLLIRYGKIKRLIYKLTNRLKGNPEK